MHVNHCIDSQVCNLLPLLILVYLGRTSIAPIVPQCKTNNNNKKKQTTVDHVGEDCFFSMHPLNIHLFCILYKLYDLVI